MDKHELIIMEILDIVEELVEEYTTERPFFGYQDERDLEHLTFPGLEAYGLIKNAMERNNL